MPPKSDAIRIRHMLDAARDAAAFCQGRQPEDLEVDRMLSWAVVKALEVIGETASQVTDETRQQLVSVPWREVVTMRHRLVHAYFNIRFDIVRNTVQDDLPPLVAALEAWLAEPA